jgi:hypothetical protein
VTRFDSLQGFAGSTSPLLGSNVRIEVTIVAKTVGSTYPPPGIHFTKVFIEGNKW